MRGVNRADDEFANIEDDQAFARFVEAKLCFLPPGLADKFRRRFSFDGSFENAQRQLTIPSDSIDSVQTTAQRASIFFQRHPYFENALGTQSEIKEADNFLEIHFVRKILAPILSGVDSVSFVLSTRSGRISWISLWRVQASSQSKLMDLGSSRRGVTSIISLTTT